MFFCFKQNTAYELRISDWSSDVCSSDLEQDVAATTRHLSDFADTACDRALAAAFAGRVPGEAARGIAVVALGKLGSHELNYSSDIDPILIFDPDTLPRQIGAASLTDRWARYLYILVVAVYLIKKN